MEQAISGLEGVSKVEVDLDAQEVKVTFEETKVQLPQMKKAIEEEGYQVVN